MKLVECVINVSEGENTDTIRRIAAAARPHAHVLHVDTSRSAGRSVITLAGPLESIGEAAFRLIKEAVSSIDMRTYRGVHPAIGAADVCPFIPLFGATMAECSEAARTVAERVGRELNLPVYLYGATASSPERRKLAYLRRAGYPALASRIETGEMNPDFGPSAVGPAGAAIVGARSLMIAYNVTLNSADVRSAAFIAGRIRESGYIQRDENGAVLRDAQGEALRCAGRFPCEAIGWRLEEHNRAQVSTNLRRFDLTPLHLIYEEVKQLAAGLQTSVSGSEIVGLVPLQAVLAAGEYYSQNDSAGESELIQAAVAGLGLSDLQAFDPAEKILEYRLAAAGLWDKSRGGLSQ